MVCALMDLPDTLEARVHGERFNGELGLGFFTQYDTSLIPLTERNRDSALEKCITIAKEIGYNHIEVAAHIPDANLRDPTGDTLDLVTLGWDVARKEKIKGWLTEAGVKISSLGCYDNMLHEDLEVRARNIAHLKKVIDAASDLGVEYVGTFAGRNMNKFGTEQWDEFETVFVDLVKYAKEKNVKLMFENCPMEGWRRGVESKVQSISHSPANWMKMFEIMEKNQLGGYLGLNLDPSHLVWQDIDPIEMVYALAEAGHADKIFHVHAKDIKIDRKKQRAEGNLGQGEPGWNLPYAHKVPGIVQFTGPDGTPTAREYRESVYWPAFISALRDVGYKGVISFEHEDHDFKGRSIPKDAPADEVAGINASNSVLRREAVQKAYNFLRSVVTDTKDNRYVANFETYQIAKQAIQRAA